MSFTVISRITYNLLCFTLTGAVQSVQVLLQLVLFAFGLLSICPRATLRGALHLLGPFGMQTFTGLSFVNQSISHIFHTCVSQYFLMEMFRYFLQTQLPQHSCVGSQVAVLYGGEKYLFLIWHFTLQGLVLIITIMREAVEEIRCYLRDKEVNSQIYSKLSTRGEAMFCLC